VIATNHAPAADVGFNGYKASGLAAATSNGDAIRWEQSAAGILTTKGDLLTRTGSGLARLAKGTDGLFLRANSAAADGLDYANPLAGYFPVTGAAADAQTFFDGAMTNGSTTLTSATANFVAGDVGKTIVVNNGKAAGTHLYGTIASRTNSTTVVLSTGCTNGANVSAGWFSYGTDDTVAVQAAVTAAVAAKGTALLPPTPTLITDAISVAGPCTIRGLAMQANIGSNNFQASGSVLVQAGASKNGITIVPILEQGDPVNLSDFCIQFAGILTNTGNGVEILPASTGGGKYKAGAYSCNWTNLYVTGVGSGSYGFVPRNTLDCRFDSCYVFGAGGFSVVAQHASLNWGAAAYTNCVVSMLAVTGNTSSAFLVAGTSSSLANQYLFERCAAVNLQPYVGSSFDAWGTIDSGGNGFNVTYPYALLINIISEDFEGLTNTLDQRSQIYVLRGGIMAGGGSVIASPGGDKLTTFVGSTATPTVGGDTGDSYCEITGLAVAITSVTAGLGSYGSTLWVAITDNGSPRAIAWGSSFENSGTVALPTTTVASTRLDVGFIWNSATTKWRCVAVA
jgi:hypothetical protein